MIDADLVLRSPAPGALPPRIVAVVPTWNGCERLAEVLASLAGQVDRVVVVDNGSTDGTAAWLAGRTGEPAVGVIHNPDNRGYPAAVNQGIARALAGRAEAVLLVNDDAIFEAGAVAALAAVLWGDPSAGAVSAKMVYRDRPELLNGTGGIVDLDRGWAWLRGSGEIDRGQYDAAELADYPSGAASLLRRAAIEAVGDFDEAFYLYYEDVDWGLRARRLGWRTRFAPAARVHHGGSTATAADPARRRYYNVRNRLRFARMHAGVRGRTWAWLAILGLLAKQAIRWFAPTRRRDAEAVAWGVLDHLRGRYGRGGWFG
jgi:GT2 family glycosyltransferase